MQNFLAMFTLNRNYPDRHSDQLLERTFKVQETEARILLTERIWSRKSEYYYRMIEPLLNGNQRIATVKRILNGWIKSNIPIYEE